MKRSFSRLLLKTFMLLIHSIPLFFLKDQRGSMACSEPSSAIRFELLRPLADELHHAVRDAVHRAGDLDRSFLF